MASLDTPEKILDRITKLLAHAKGTTIAAEAESFMAKAQSLMQQYGVEAADLDGREETVYARVMVQHPYTEAKSALLRIIAARNHCGMTYASWKDDGIGTPYRGRKCVLWGRPRDIAFAERMSASLSAQCVIEMFRAPIPPMEHGKTFRNNFIYGYAYRIDRRLKEIDNDPESTGFIYGGLIDDDGFYRHPTTYTVSAAGLSAGEAAANRANLGEANERVPRAR